MTHSVLAVTSKTPRDCSAGDIDAFQSLVLEGGEVEPNGLAQRIARAERLAIALRDHILVGVGALKSPNSGYRKSVFAKSGTPRSPTAFELELGWVYVKPECRGGGISGRLVQELMAAARGRNVFATSRTDNAAMRRSLERAGFVRDGKPYSSDMRAQELLLFVWVSSREHR